MNLNLRSLMARLQEQEPPPPWSAATGVGLVIAYFVLQVSALTLFSVLVDAEAARVGLVSPAVVNFSAIVAGLLAVLLLWLVLRRRAPTALARALRIERPVGSAWLLVLFSLGAAILVDFVPLAAQAAGLPGNLLNMAGASGLGWVLAAVFTALVGPLALALLLQGALYPAVAARRGNLQAIVLTALVYMALQVALGNPGDASLWGQMFFTGLYVTGARAYQQSTRAALVAHLVIGVFWLFKAGWLFLYAPTLVG